MVLKLIEVDSWVQGWSDIKLLSRKKQDTSQKVFSKLLKTMWPE